MKRKTTLFIITFLIIGTSLFADVIPEPVVVKGIVPSHAVNIQMVSEVVKVNLSMDSSFVECTFHMHNWGRQTEIDVGFPIMNFYLWERDYLNPVNKNQFDVIVNGQSINKINIYIPDELKNLLTSVEDGKQYDTLREYKNSNKPWYLWKMHFSEKANTTIIIRYRLPNGATRISHFFDYLLSTGAGWKGNINDAKVIVKLNEVANVQMMDIKPKQFYKPDRAEIIWHFKNLKPTINNDIFLEFETSKGAYKAIQADWDLTRLTYVDGKKTKYSSVDAGQMGDVHIEETANGQFAEAFFTKTFILNKLKNMVRKSNPASFAYISTLSPKFVDKRCEVQINGEHLAGDKLYEKLNDIDSTNTVFAEVKKLDGGRRGIIIKTKNPITHLSITHKSPQR